MKDLLKLSRYLAPILAVLLISSVVLAITMPDSIAMSDTVVFRNVIETGDQLWFTRHDVSYSPEPSELASIAFQMTIFGLDGATQIATRGITDYQHDVISIYLTPTQALTWQGAYTVRLMGNPALFGVLTEDVNMQTTLLGPGNYFEATDLGQFIVQQAMILEDDWAITLLTSADKLNSSGSIVFREAIPGLESMAPEIFQAVESIPSGYGQGTDTTKATEMATHKGSKLQNAINGIGSIFGGSANWTQFFITMLVGALLASIVFAATQNPGWGLLMMAFSFPASAWIGMLDWSIYVIAVTTILFLGGILFFRSQTGT